MRRLLTIILILFSTNLVFADNFATCDPKATVKNKVINYFESIDGSDLTGIILKQPDVSTVYKIVPIIYWKCDIDKNAVIEMTQAEKDIIDAEIKNQNQDSALDYNDKLVNTTALINVLIQMGVINKQQFDQALLQYLGLQ